jgi:hypothetical protein
LAVRCLWLARCSDPRGLGSALPLAMFKLLYRGKRGAERAEALLGPRRDDDRWLGENNLEESEGYLLDGHSKR